MPAEGESRKPVRLTRRAFTGAMTGVLGAAVGARLYYRKHYEAGQRASVFVGKAASYSGDLSRVIEDGVRELGLAKQVRGRRVLLKPNLVEPYPDAAQINTHPLVVQAAAATFLRLGAAAVAVGEGQGHRRDTLLVLEDSGLAEVLREDRIRFIDLNSESVYRAPNVSGRSGLGDLLLPEAIRGFDWIVSMPKLKTHHWAGVTLAMKNLFGLMPGIVYGWPKNVLHQAGIVGSILDINATVRPRLAIVDGIVGMEGDGPIMGTAKHAGVLVMGANFPAVDATSARIMGIDPEKIEYLSDAAGWLGPIRAPHIRQRGESPLALRTDFRLIDRIDALRGIRLARG